MRLLLLSALAIIATGCAAIKTPPVAPQNLVTTPQQPADWLLYYQNLVAETYAIATPPLDSAYRQTDAVFGDIVYAPDSAFVIYSVVVESCGAYCNALWNSWLHISGHADSIRLETDFNSIDAIHILPNGVYLVLQNSWERPASVLTLTCNNAAAFVIDNSNLQFVAIPYKGLPNFQFCEENGIDKDPPHLTWDPDLLRLEYAYANNFAYSTGVDTSLLYAGYFQFNNGVFELAKEAIEVLPETGAAPSE